MKLHACNPRKSSRSLLYAQIRPHDGRAGASVTEGAQRRPTVSNVESPTGVPPTRSIVLFGLDGRLFRTVGLVDGAGVEHARLVGTGRARAVPRRVFVVVLGGAPRLGGLFLGGNLGSPLRLGLLRLTPRGLLGRTGLAVPLALRALLRLAPRTVLRRRRLTIPLRRLRLTPRTRLRSSLLRLTPRPLLRRRRLTIPLRRLRLTPRTRLRSSLP